MANETKVQDRNGDKRIIKRNKLKISIIVIVVLVLLTLLGVGIYFIVKATKKYDYEVDGVEMKADINDVRDDILDDNQNKVGIFFYEDDSANANYLLRGDQTYSEGEDGTGPLSEIMVESIESNDYTWYGVNLDDADYIIEQLFLTTTPKGSVETHMFYDQLEYLATGNRDADIWYFDSIDYNSFEDNSYVIDDGATNPKFSTKEVDANKKKDWTTDLLIEKDSDSSESSSFESWDPTAGTMMLFNGSTLTSIVDGWTLPESAANQDDPDSDSQANIVETFKSDILNPLLDHNNNI